MAFEITSYTTHRVKAEAKNGGTSNWVVLTVIERPGRDSEITLFFDGPYAAAKAQAYAEAINAADRSLHPLDVARELADAE